MKSILILTMYGNLAASSRQRVIQYVPALELHGFNVKIEPLFPNEYLKNIFNNNKTSYLKVLSWYLRRLRIIFSSSKYDMIWIQYEIFPHLPSIFERVILLFNKNIILDFDDAIFHKYDLWGNFLTKFFLSNKLELLSKKAKTIICGNNYIKNWAEQYCKNTILIPTVIDYKKYSQLTSFNNDSVFTLGWIGSPATWLYMAPLIPTLTELTKKYNFKVLIVGSGIVSTKNSNFIYKSWSEKEEIQDLSQMDVGIMPLFNDPWALGKCGYKLIQYMACSKAVIASPVGVNQEIIEDGDNGLFATSLADWEKAITSLLFDKDLRKRMGYAGSQKVKNEYSLESQKKKLLKLIAKIADE